MKAPITYVLYIDRGPEEHLVSLWRTLDDAEDTLREYAGTIFVGVTDDDDIVETLAEDGKHVRIFACTMKHNRQISTELKPFTRAAKVA
jgi:hypothetical protein